LLSTPLEELGGLSASEIVATTSQSLQLLEIKLGYRDEATLKPLKRLPKYTL